jgi:hypothetical protein
MDLRMPFCESGEEYEQARIDLVEGAQFHQLLLREAMTAVFYV